MDNKIGKLIAKFRKEKGLTQKELGDKLFVTDKAVSKWERGLSLPDITLFEKLAKVLDTDIYSLIGIEKNNKDDVLKVIEEEKIKLKKQFRNRLIIIFVFVLVIVLVFLFKMVSFGYVTKHFRYSSKLINLGVPKFSFLMQNKENNYSFKSFRGKEVLKNEVKDFLNTLEFMTCNDTVYYYDKSSDVTIIDYNVISNLFYSTISYSVRSGNYCDRFKVIEYGDILGGLNKRRYTDNDNIYIEFIPSYIEEISFVSHLIIVDKNTDEVLEDSSGTFEIKGNELIYFREKINKESIDVPNKSVFKIKDKKLILEDNYLYDYIDVVVL